VRHRRDHVLVAAAKHLLVPLEQLDQLGVRTAVVAAVRAPRADALAISASSADMAAASPGAVPSL
jgi:hypothetical protein